jgi:predicted transcriptional regulator
MQRPLLKAAALHQPESAIMNPQLLIDAIVRHTTVLVARLSTVEGARSPLGHIANEVFVGLVSELEDQGVSKKVIADMFGMALRSYRQKVQRLGESATTRGVTLWSAVQHFLAERGSATRSELIDHFNHDDEASIRGILNDLAESGLVVRSGRGDDTRHRIATAEELRDAGALVESRPQDSLAALVWVQVYREGPLSLDRLCQLVPLSRAALNAAVASLVDDGRIRRESHNGVEHLVAEHVLIPVGETAGWEAALIDHHGAVLNAIAAKLASRAHTSTAADEVGGTTLTFDLWPGHPRELEVRGLLRLIRNQVLPLWEEVEKHNREHPGPETYQLHFYCGQYLVVEEQQA